MFPADTTLWREGIFSTRRMRFRHATSAATFELDALPPGDYYIAAVSARLTAAWHDPPFLSQALEAQGLLERLIPGATRFTLGDGEEKTISLKTFTPQDR